MKVWQETLKGCKTTVIRRKSKSVFCCLSADDIDFSNNRLSIASPIKLVNLNGKPLHFVG